LGREQLLALARVIEEQLAAGQDNVIVGTWGIQYDKERGAFMFEKCEFGNYCEERPSVITTGGEILDRGGPLFQD